MNKYRLFYGNATAALNNILDISQVPIYCTHRVIFSNSNFIALFSNPMNSFFFIPHQNIHNNELIFFKKSKNIFFKIAEFRN